MKKIFLLAAALSASTVFAFASFSNGGPCICCLECSCPQCVCSETGCDGLCCETGTCCDTGCCTTDGCEVK